MRVMIDCRPLFRRIINDDTAAFIFESLKRLEWINPDWERIYLTDKNNSHPAAGWMEPKQMRTVNSFGGTMGWKYWYNRQLPSILKKQQINFLFTTGGIAAKTPVPQCTWVPFSAGLPPEKNRNYYRFFKRKLSAADSSSSCHFLVSAKNAELISSQNRSVTNRLHILKPPSAGNQFAPGWTDRENTRIKYSGGKDYFLLFAEESYRLPAVLEILKGFSLFKKWQESNMQLVITGKKISADFSLLEKLESYKYRSDVHVIGKAGGEEWSRLLGSAYALLYPFDDDGYAVPAINAFDFSVPVIGSEQGGLAAAYSSIAVFAEQAVAESWSKQMMAVYKDEVLRNRLIEQGKMEVLQNNWDHCIGIIRNAMEDAMKN